MRFALKYFEKVGLTKFLNFAKKFNRVLLMRDSMTTFAGGRQT